MAFVLTRACWKGRCGAERVAGGCGGAAGRGDAAGGGGGWPRTPPGPVGRPGDGRHGRDAGHAAAVRGIPTQLVRGCRSGAGRAVVDRLAGVRPLGGAAVTADVLGPAEAAL